MMIGSLFATCCHPRFLSHLDFESSEDGEVEYDSFRPSSMFRAQSTDRLSILKSWDIMYDNDLQ